ncbi:MAG: 50S ribosomal protein L11 methyltransferase [Desulfarculaceae bacterium]|nr:50S ribosomal protein L11 methyltransferase [Desulfarculaceae bacterium]MCF8073041.1 50S ribosomal protein L11 methyltransferase [Desulfarculaceae bacterium]MCF8101874.1 50S ribosomal protein L11 methyltransferase [Desulfarculaceae bacterium]MCF8115401.1 50S ribosomal protein L11 methyltransferase [Desulfarculaceae bacterium]
MNPHSPQPPAAWLEIRLSAPAPIAEAAADLLTALTGHGVILDEPDDGRGLVAVRAFLEAGPEMGAQRSQVELYARQLASGPDGDAVSLEFADLPAEDWGGAWKRYFHPRLVTQRLIVAPPWEQAQPGEGQVVLVIDPGQAFGTGQHQSTQLVLRRLERLADRAGLPANLLDVGCGSGILSLAALKFGAGRAVGIDLEPEAVAASRANAELNRLRHGLEVSLTPLAEIEERFPLVLANITAMELCGLAEQLAAHLAPGGELVLSGLLVDQIPKVLADFAGQGLDLKEQDSLAGWASLVLA